MRIFVVIVVISRGTRTSEGQGLASWQGRPQLAGPHESFSWPPNWPLVSSRVALNKHNNRGQFKVASNPPTYMLTIAARQIHGTKTPQCRRFQMAPLGNGATPTGLVVVHFEETVS